MTDGIYILLYFTIHLHHHPYKLYISYEIRLPPLLLNTTIYDSNNSKTYRMVLVKLFFLEYRCDNTKRVHVPLSQHKTCTRTAITTQNMYTYHCHNTNM